MKKISSFVGLGLATFLALSLSFAPIASAAEFLAPADTQGNVTLSSTETHHNAYVAGGSVFANSTITGDLYAVGGSLTIEGSVEQDLVVAGGNITVNGPIGGDIRVAGGTVIINSKVNGDVVVAGGTVTFTEKSSVGGDAMLAAGEVRFDGPVIGNVKVRGGQVTINSTVTGNVDVMADQSLTFGSKAVVASKILYKGSKEAVVTDGAQISAVEYQPLANRAGNKNAAGDALAGIFTFFVLIKAIGGLILGLILIKLFPRSTKELVGSFQNKPWHNLGIGFLALIVGPIAAMILIITFVGMYVAFMLLLAWLLIIFIAAIVACIFAGVWLIKLYKKNEEVKADWKALVVGLVAMTVISFIPVIGMLVYSVLMLIAFGSLLRHLQGYIKEEQNSVVETPSTPTII